MTKTEIIASFETAGQQADAVRLLEAAGFTGIKSYSPYDPDLSCPDPAPDSTSLVPAASLAGGVGGVVLAGFFQAYLSIVSWPLNVGGKPFFAWPAFLPVTFEFMILGAVSGALIAFLRGMRSDDQVSVAALDSAMRGGRFALRVPIHGGVAAIEATSRIAECGGTNRTRVLAPPTRWRNGLGKRLNRGRINNMLGGVTLACFVAAAAIWPDRTRPNYVFAPDMAESPALSAYSVQGWHVAPNELRQRPGGTIARGEQPLRYGSGEAEALRAGAELSMPNDIAAAPEIGAGAGIYQALCRTCHGDEGHGDGVTMKRGFQPPASLLTQQARDMADGKMFHVLTFGQNLMPSHMAQLSTADRWRVIRYVRSLQDRLPVDPPPFEPAPVEPEASP